jgi:drug/metabolite transporter (DMT)-like permease
MSSKKGYLFALYSTLGAGMTTVIGKWTLEEISALALTCVIFTVSTIALTVGWLPFRGSRQVFALTRKGWFWTLMFSITSWLAIWIFWAGVKLIDPTLAGFINRFEVPIVILLGVVLLKERFSRIEVIGMILSLAGIVIMKLTLRIEFSTGFWLVLLGATFFGLTEYVSKIALRHVEPIPLAYLRNAFLAVGYWAVFLAGDYSMAGMERVWPGAVAVGLIGPLVTRLMYLLALKHLDLSKVAVVSQIQPVFVILIALTFLGQFPTLREIAGGVCLLAGCVVMVLGRFRGRRQDAART